MEIRSATESEVSEALAGGRQLPLVPLALDMCSCFTQEETHGNFYKTLERGYKNIIPLLGKSIGKSCSIIGAGPSLKRTYTELVGDVFSVNSSLWFLLDKGIVPKYQMIWDAHELCAKFAVPHPDITYLIASRCHPKVFEKLKGCDVYVWHAGGDHNINEVLERAEVQQKMGGVEPLIGGGSAGVTRGLYVTQALGYSDIHFFGGDSSYEGNETHIMGSLMKEKDMMCSMGDGTPGSPATWFRTTPEWVQQVNEYRIMYGICALQTGIKMEVHGEGTMLHEMHKRLVGKRALMGDEKLLLELVQQEAKQGEHNALASGLTNTPPPQPLEEATQ